MDQQDVWDKIAIPWDDYRVNPMKEVIEFLKNKKGRILDLGCGSGRNFTRVNGMIYGIDFSKTMLKYAEKKADRMCIDAEFTQAEVQKVPYQDNYFDAALFVAVLHCIKGESERKKAVKELFRLLKPGAEAIITVWSKNDERVKGKPQEALVPWSVRGNKVMRYYYIFEQPELESLLKHVGFEILSSKEDRNIVFIVKKPEN